MKRPMFFALLFLFGCKNPFEPTVTCGWANVALPNSRVRVEGVPGVQLVEAKVRVCPTSEGPALQLYGANPIITVELQVHPSVLRQLR